MNSGPLIAFAGGGSGGHLYPVLAVANRLAALIPGLRLLFLATDRVIDAHILAAESAEVVRQTVRPLPRRPWQWPGFLLGWRRSRQDCRRRFRRERPMAVLGSGGFASAPAICEAARVGIPTALLNPDAVPGRANRWLGPRADAIFAQWADTVDHFNGHTQVLVTGCPVRPEFREADREAGIQHFGLDPAKKTLLVTGASLGARSLNEAMVAALPELRRSGLGETWQVLHLTGDKEKAAVTAGYGSDLAGVRIVGFTKHMALALSAANLVVCRAGASTLAEITAMGRPAVLMPYPHHGDLHQVANSRVLVKAGAGRMVLDHVDPARNGPVLAQALTRLMSNPAELGRLAGAARRIGTSNAATAIAEHLIHLAGRESEELVKASEK
ncbi:MAG: glycosyltransferase [Phycisphaerae bacterium]